MCYDLNVVHFKLSELQWCKKGLVQKIRGQKEKGLAGNEDFVNGLMFFKNSEL